MVHKVFVSAVSRLWTALIRTVLHLQGFGLSGMAQLRSGLRFPCAASSHGLRKVDFCSKDWALQHLDQEGLATAKSGTMQNGATLNPRASFLEIYPEA